MATSTIPLVFQPSFAWAGNDGNWSTYQLAVGTPPQRFNVLPSTGAAETWIPAPEACAIKYPNCTITRGVLSTQGAPSAGFQANASSTWDQIGLYKLGFEGALFNNDDSGLYGQDILAFGDYIPGVENQTVAGIATPNFWLGIFGLGVRTPEFDTRPDGIPSLLSTLEAQNMTPSLSYGYSAGASYRDSPGSLVVGGFDQNAFEPNDLSFILNFSGARSLTTSVHSIVVTNTAKGTISMPLGSPLNMSIDSTVSQLWLPESTCESLAESLGLSYDSATDLYLVNTTSHAQLLQSSPEFTFTLAANETSNHTMNIVLPYAAFDLQAGLPMFNASTPYFPIRRAANESQQVLGRAFLQEAYIIVDWERQNFSLGQAAQVYGGVSNNIVPILSPGVEITAEKQTLPIGVIAGIVVGVVAALMGVAIVALWLWRRSRSPTKQIQPSQSRQGGPVADLAELTSNERYELHDFHLRHQLMSTAVFELPGHSVEHELPVQEKQASK